MPPFTFDTLKIVSRNNLTFTGMFLGTALLTLAACVPISRTEEGMRWYVTEDIPPAPGELGPSQRVSHGDATCDLTWLRLVALRLSECVNCSAESSRVDQ